MILLLPIGLLLTAALAILILDRVRPKFGTSWLIATAAALIAWGLIFFLRLRLPTTFDLHSWDLPQLSLIGRFSLLLDYDSWPYLLAVMTISLSVILTDAARTRYDSTPRSWAASLMITALSLLALLSGTSLTLMIAWVIADFLELLYLLRLKDSRQFTNRIILSFGVRIAAIMVLFIATAQSSRIDPNFTLAQIPPQTGFIFLLSAGLRLGVFPLNLPFLQDPSLRRGAGNIIRLAPVASSLCLLARLPVNLIPGGLSGWMPLINGMLALAGLYASIRWLTAADEIEGRPFWIVAWASLATTSVLNGEPAASLAWGIALLLPGSLLFLYYPRIQRINFLLIFGLIGLLGLPYTPAASGWVGLIGDGFSIWTLLFILIHMVMVLGYLNRALSAGGEAGALESWARLVYPLGLILIIQAILALGLIGWPNAFTLGVWWLPLISLMGVIATVIIVQRYDIRPPYLKLPRSKPLVKVAEWILPRIEPIFRLEWLYRLIWQIYTFLGFLLHGFSTLLEGEGGILWTIMLLILLVSLLTAGRMN